ncbi:MAG: hypothetical protein CL935_04525 [Deltaproteobacteria bacterium]|nr:hypothetical protein [Deltaproteobacteria bacterium]
MEYQHYIPFEFDSLSIGRSASKIFLELSTENSKYIYLVQDYSETLIFQEVFQNASRARHVEELREGLFKIFRAVLCIQILSQFRSVKLMYCSGRKYTNSMEGANFLT